MISAPVGATGLWVLTDRCGTILARSRHEDRVTASLFGHLEAFLPAPPGATKLGMRAFVSGELAVLALFPVGFTGPLIERRMQAIGWSMVDRLAVDVSDRGCLVLRERAPGRARPSWPGHICTDDRGITVNAVLAASPAPASLAYCVAELASTAIDGDRRLALDLSSRLAECERRFVDLSEKGSLEQALVRG